MTTELVLGGTLQIRDEEKREVSVFVLPWDKDAKTARGLEQFARGSFDGIDPSRFVFRQRHADPPTGRGIELSEEDDGLHMAFRIAKTAAGDEQLELIREGVETGVSVGFEDGKYERKRLSDGRMQYFHQRVNEEGQLEVSTTWKPAYREAAVLQLRESDMAEATEAATAEASAPVATTEDAAIIQLREAVMTRIDKIDEQQRALKVLAPAAEAVTTERPSVLLQVRELQDIITTDNAGVVPDAFVNDMLGRIAADRPFLNSTRRLTTPQAGTSIVLPIITQNPIVGVQASEKDDLASQKTIISTVDFGMETVGGAGDLSLQLIRRSSPEFLNLWLELLGEQYALETEDNAVDALLAESAVVEGGAFDPEEPQFGDAFANTVAATGGLMKPNRIWLSTSALVALMNATVPSGGGGGPLYPALSGIGGIMNGGSSDLGISLQPIWTPTLDNEAVDIIVGPSNGYAWAEDGTFVLQADVPSKAGRDVGLVGFVWYAPLYPAAFTTYTLAT